MPDSNYSPPEQSESTCPRCLLRPKIQGAPECEECVRDFAELLESVFWEFDPEHLMPATFGEELMAARHERTPEMALRRDSQDRLDDVVVKGVETFHAEMMSDDTLWLCCYFRNGERVTFSAYARKRGCLEFETGELPEDWIDWDERRWRQQ